jgi:hypothetical protein
VPMLIFVLTRKLLLFLIILVLEQTIISKYSEVQILQSSASRHHFRPLMRFFYHSRRELRYYMSSMTPNLYPYNLIMFYFTYFIWRTMILFWNSTTRYLVLVPYEFRNELRGTVGTSHYLPLNYYILVFPKYNIITLFISKYCKITWNFFHFHQDKKDIDTFEQA